MMRRSACVDLATRWRICAPLVRLCSGIASHLACEGVRIHQYASTAPVGGKVADLMDDWSNYIGSCNLDPPSASSLVPERPQTCDVAQRLAQWQLQRWSAIAQYQRRRHARRTWR